MKYIQKRGVPRLYAQWCARVAGTANEDFRDLPNAEKQGLLSALIQEQGALCAYTMRRIDESTSHVEHIKPYRCCRTEQPRSDLDFKNLVACFPRGDMEKRYRYGAQLKGDWWQNDGASFISPLHPSCETRFLFNLDGEIKPVENDDAAVNTISVLGLDNRSLTDDRRRVVQEFIYGPNGDDPLSHAQATNAGLRICDRRRRGEFYEFCVAIRHALGQYLKLLQQRAQRHKALRSRN